MLVWLGAACGTPVDAPRVWHEEDGYRWIELPPPSGSGAGFEELPASKTGIAFVNTLPEADFLQNRHYLNGAGVAVGDVDGDGLPDLYLARLRGPNALYRNRGGWRFEDVTEAAGVAAPDRFSTGAVFADVDGDGDLDLLLTAMGGPHALFLNDGTGRFTDASETAGLRATPSGSTSMALADVDGDGDLDLYVAAYKTRSAGDIFPPHVRSLERTVIREEGTYKIAPGFEEHYALIVREEGLLRIEKGEADVFYENTGGGRFRAVPWTDGAFRDEDGRPLPEPPLDWGLAARFQDVNGDLVPDLYVCNDFESPDRFWLGDGRGGFRLVPRLALRKTSLSTMSVAFSDVDRDGHLDFFLADMLSRDYRRRQTQVGLTIPMTTGIGEIDDRPQVVQNTLQWNRGDGTYAEVARMSGVAASEWTWSSTFLDVDLDGYEDLLLTTGHTFDVQHADAQRREMQRTAALTDPQGFRRLLLDFPGLYLKNIAFRNRGDLTFEEVPDGWGLGSRPDVSHGMALGDFDGDGDLDVVVNRLHEAAGVFRNEATAPRLAVRLHGRAGNTQGIGARVRVYGGPVPVQEQEVTAGGQYLSGSEALLSFAAGDGRGGVAANMTIEVRWRSGRRTRIEGVAGNRLYEIYEPSTPAPAAPAADTAAAPVFADVSDRLGHTHPEAPYRDYDRQPLLPRRLSRLGPGVAWADLDGDGDDDLLIGAGRGGRLAVFLNDGHGRLRRSPAGEEAPDDLTGLVAIPRPEGGALVLAGVSNYESGLAGVSRIDVYAADAAGRLVPHDRLPFGRDAIGPLVPGDFDGDGDLDLFAGGRLVPGRYPEPASSRLFRNDEGRFRHDSGRSAPFDAVGLVSGATAADLDGDGRLDLVLATEWGALRYFRNEGDGRFADRTEAAGLSRFTGWWNAVAPGDFDGDGRLDLVATNWGWNGLHGRHGPGNPPLRLYYGDFDANGIPDVLEAHYEPSMNDYVPDRGLNVLMQALPYVGSRVASFEQFAAATLRELVGPRLDRAAYLEATTLAHMLFLNRATGDGQVRFEAVPLPVEAQVAPAFAVVVGDFDADGREDVFLSQNFFALPFEVPRQDAGRGLWLRGDGTGGFEAVPGHVSGLRIYGEGRAAAAADFDGDGRTDLVVTQNGAETKLYRNTGATAGLRVRLEGPPGNAAGLGAVVRLAYADGTLGPARVVTAGAGYWSQSSPVQVMGAPAEAVVVAVRVRWPDGRRTEHAVPPGATEVRVGPADQPPRP
ncbi:VCBS repeat-containing protein [Rhodocaloribacter litoris]|uniref:FG-GAP-like repeat-containing protein n=1 Tax=Rhodocaloribacter litoris TaxID=2558931 RepID=UPI001E4558DA|nr:FG-GAP-like repeat-containing protein [Rhodocaloribacter litoris]QXD16562.1 VCBS repeat-containing protein [Rhodocaloribacter litoris]